MPVEPPRPTDTPITRTRSAAEGCICARVYKPVCSSGAASSPTFGTSFGNECEARCAGVVVFTDGECGKTGTSTSTGAPATVVVDVVVGIEGKVNQQGESDTADASAAASLATDDDPGSASTSSFSAAVGAAVGALLIVGMLVGVVVTGKRGAHPDADESETADIESGRPMSPLSADIAAVGAVGAVAAGGADYRVMGTGMYSNAADAIYDGLDTGGEDLYGTSTMVPPHASAGDMYSLASYNHGIDHQQQPIYDDASSAASAPIASAVTYDIATASVDGPIYDDAVAAAVTYDIAAASVDGPIYDHNDAAGCIEAWAPADLDPHSASFRIKSVVRNNPLAAV